MSGRRLILGTAGHIDHGKTALVRALTGVDTDRLREEKERGITIELGFAELRASDALTFGVVDVPGHEGFVRTMVAGAAGVDVVLLVVAADEGVMPQTREHLAIVQLLGARRLVVALTKTDLVEEDWLELVREDVREALADTPFGDAPLVPVSARTGEGLDDLRHTLARVGEAVPDRSAADLARLPVDRVFTVQGTGTVVTGTLWSGRLEVGDQARLLPTGRAVRIRALQVHGGERNEARAGERTAVALTGPGLERADVLRGQTLVTSDAWTASHMLTVHLRVLPDTGWQVRHNQRVRVHLGTAEVMARVAT
ncbi:MAG: selenocysteine-specific translation elongation factor, partial [Gemmatimonadetes bacterium]